MNYKLKYFKYKNKYINLKKILGGSEFTNTYPEYLPDSEYRNFDLESYNASKYIFYNYRPSNYLPSPAEYVGSGQLSNQMTKHGLGSGFYGLIDTIYPSNYGSTEKMELRLINPLILDSLLKANLISVISKNLNILINKFIEEDNINYDEIEDFFNKLEINNWDDPNFSNLRDKYIKEQKEQNPDLDDIDCETEFYEINKSKIIDPDGNISLLNELNISDIKNTIKNFIKDYNEINEGQCVPLPINYLLSKRYDGIYNEYKNSIDNGSILFINKIKSGIYPRSYKSNLTTEIPIYFTNGIVYTEIP